MQALREIDHEVAFCRVDLVAFGSRPRKFEPRGVLLSATSSFNEETNEMKHDAPERLAPSESFWTREDVRDPERWTLTLDTDVQAELRRTVRALHGREIASLKPSDVLEAGPLAEASSRWREELRSGLGFVLLRGLDVDAFSPEELALAFAVLGLHLGTPVPQNLRGDLLTHIRDTGADPSLLSTRLYTTRAEQDFHTDGADIIGLLCRRTARAGGESRIVSSGAIVRELQDARPDLYRTLFENFPWHYQEEGQPPFWFARPICTAPAEGVNGAQLNTFFIPWYIRRSQELTDAPRLTSLQHEALEALERLANDSRYYLNMTFSRGDVQWLKNAAILHKRTAYEDHETREEKRHLLRLWLSAPDFLDGDAQLRRGVTR
jgi:hypothetical protein